MSDNMEFLGDSKLSKGLVETVSSFKDKWKKYITTISLFGNLYFFAKERELIELVDTILERTKYIEWFDDGS